MNMFQEGGWWMYPITLVGLGLVPEAIILAEIGLSDRHRNRLPMFGVTLIVSGFAPLALGAVGYALNMQLVRAALATVTDSVDRETILAAAQGEALTTIIWGLMLSVFPVCAGCVLLGVGLSRLPRFQADAHAPVHLS
jgi:hypothetical protein